MSNPPPPDNTWGRPAPPSRPAHAELAPPSPGGWTAPPAPAPAEPGGGARKGNQRAVIVGVVAVIALAVGGFLIFGGDDDNGGGMGGGAGRGGVDVEGGGAAGGDPEDAIEDAEQAVQTVLDGDCDEAAELATDNFTDELADLCGHQYPDSEITGASLASESPVVVLVEFTVQDAELSYPFEMSYDDTQDRWLVDALATGAGEAPGTESAEPGTTGPEADVTAPSGTAEPGEDPDIADSTTEGAIAVAEAAIDALATGDCPGALRLATPRFVEEYGDTICEQLPPDTSPTGAELIGEDPVVVSVDTDAGFGIELEMVLVDGAWLVDDYSV